MSTIRTLTMIAALAAGSVACHGKPDNKAASADKPASADKASSTDKASGATAPGSADQPAAAAKELVPEADAERFYAFIEQLVTVAVANQDDCVKLAAALNAHFDANTAVIKDAGAMMKQNKEMPPAIKEKMNKKLKDELGPAVTKKCGRDKAVGEAFRKFAAK